MLDQGDALVKQPVPATRLAHRPAAHACRASLSEEAGPATPATPLNVSRHFEHARFQVVAAA
jgi:hypothetical protein